ncbi:alkaline phosphatase family protein [Dyella tabacisoli]|uniref:Phosphoesterase n=1 Tax=Dyella tabacisoli TaxID=2282381 RepID=A0A369UP54_9GAMM|nr:alkaline phosphatase family protein [Dyella tabacisoli]RDD80109.1 hypothetical protein DVJ77_18355 [Dyella tabacisoli]
MSEDASSASNPASESVEIQHVFIVMLENRSFDHLLGSLPWLPADSSVSSSNMETDSHLFKDREGRNLAPNEPTASSVRQLPLVLDYLTIGDYPHSYYHVTQSLGIQGQSKVGFVNSVVKSDLEDLGLPSETPGAAANVLMKKAVALRKTVSLFSDHKFDYNGGCSIDSTSLCGAPDVWLKNNDVLRRHQAMSYYPYGSLKVFHKLAEEFCVCDRYFASIPGPTWPNRLFALLGSSDGWLSQPDTSWIIKQSTGFEKTSVFDLFTNLEQWRVYTNGSFGSFSEVFSEAVDDDTITNHGTIDDFKAECRGYSPNPPSPITPRLPKFLWVEPTYAGLHAQDAHPYHSMANAEHFISEIYGAIRGNEELWKRSLLIVTFDEHGGLYDHVAPPKKGDEDPLTGARPVVPPKPGATSFREPDVAPPFKYDQFGVRVPCLLISPWVRKGSVDSVWHDHASLIKEVADRLNLNLDRMNSGVGRSGDLDRIRASQNFKDGKDRAGAKVFIEGVPRTDCITARELASLSPSYMDSPFPWETKPGISDVFVGEFKPDGTTSAYVRAISTVHSIDVSLKGFSSKSLALPAVSSPDFLPPQFAPISTTFSKPFTISCDAGPLQAILTVTGRMVRIEAGGARTLANCTVPDATLSYTSRGTPLIDNPLNHLPSGLYCFFNRYWSAIIASGNQLRWGDNSAPKYVRYDAIQHTIRLVDSTDPAATGPYLFVPTHQDHGRYYVLMTDDTSTLQDFQWKSWVITGPADGRNHLRILYSPAGRKSGAADGPLTSTGGDDNRLYVIAGGIPPVADDLQTFYALRVSTDTSPESRNLPTGLYKFFNTSWQPIECSQFENISNYGWLKPARPGTNTVFKYNKEEKKLQVYWSLPPGHYIATGDVSVTDNNHPTYPNVLQNPPLHTNEGWTVNPSDLPWAGAAKADGRTALGLFYSNDSFPERKGAMTNTVTPPPPPRSQSRPMNVVHDARSWPHQSQFQLFGLVSDGRVDPARVAAIELPSGKYQLLTMGNDILDVVTLGGVNMPRHRGGAAESTAMLTYSRQDHTIYFKSGTTEGYLSMGNGTRSLSIVSAPSEFDVGARSWVMCYPGQSEASAMGIQILFCPFEYEDTYYGPGTVSSTGGAADTLFIIEDGDNNNLSDRRYKLYRTQNKPASHLGCYSTPGVDIPDGYYFVQAYRPDIVFPHWDLTSIGDTVRTHFGSTFKYMALTVPEGQRAGGVVYVCLGNELPANLAKVDGANCSQQLEGTSGAVGCKPDSIGCSHTPGVATSWALYQLCSDPA